MARVRPFGVFILVLCLVACVCEHAVGNKEEATKIVNEAKAAAEKTLKDAKQKLSEAETCLDDANEFKEDAEETAAEAARAAKGNQAAEAIAKKVKNASDEALKLFPKTSTSAKDIVDKMKPLVTKATDLDARAAAIRIETETTDDYAETKKSAEAVKTEVDALDKEIKTASSSLGTVATSKIQMSEFVKTAELATYHVDVIVAVTKFETLLKSADNNIKLTEQKRDEIVAIEKDMKEIYDNSPKDLIHSFSGLLSLVRDHFGSASNSVEKAKQAKEGILELKEQANGALVNVAAATDIDKAWDADGITRTAVKNAEEKLKDTKNALQSAQIKVLNALQLKKTALYQLNKKNKKPDVTQDAKVNPQGTTESPEVIGTKQPTITKPDLSRNEQPVQDTTESPEVIETKQPTTTNPDQSMNEQPVKDTTESPAVIGTTQPTITYPDQSVNEQPVQDTTESPAVIGTKQPTVTNPDLSRNEQPVQDTTESLEVIGTKQPTITNPDLSRNEQPVKDTTESPEVIGTKQPTITNPDLSRNEQPVQDTTESPEVIGTKQPTITNPDLSRNEQPVKDTTESPEVIETKQPTITNPDQPGSGGTEPTQPSSSDGAMTVSVPLLLALIACAALH